MIQISKPIIKKAEIEAVIKVLQSGNLVQGEKVKQLERDIASLSEAKFAIATNNGTSSLHTALQILGIGRGDEVITTPFTFVATASSILMTGAKPVFADIREDTYNINPKEIEKKINKKTKAIIAVDLYGQPAEYNEINKIAKKHKLYVIGDAAQSIGAEYFGKKTGNLTDIACFSLYATKNITSGEGGIITTNKNELNKKARIFRNQGQSEKTKYEYLGLGYNYRMTEIQAAIAIEQLKRLPELTKKRQKIAKIYNKNFQNIPGLILPVVKENTSSVYHQYTLRITKKFKLSRDKLMDYLQKKGIQTNIYYPIPLYKFEHLKLGNSPREFPVAERVAKEVISIPVHPLLSTRQIEYIISTIKKI